MWAAWGSTSLLLSLVSPCIQGEHAARKEASLAQGSKGNVTGGSPDRARKRAKGSPSFARSTSPEVRLSLSNPTGDTATTSDSSGVTVPVEEEVMSA